MLALVYVLAFVCVLALVCVIVGTVGTERTEKSYFESVACS